MHFPSEGYYFVEIAPWLTLFLLVLGVVAAWKMFRRTLGDHAKDELEQLNKRYAKGLLSFEQYQRKKAQLHPSKMEAREANNVRPSKASESSSAETPDPASGAKPETISPDPDVVDSGTEPPP